MAARRQSVAGCMKNVCDVVACRTLLLFYHSILSVMALPPMEIEPRRSTENASRLLLVMPDVVMKTVSHRAVVAPAVRASRWMLLPGDTGAAAVALADEMPSLVRFVVAGSRRSALAVASALNAVPNFVALRVPTMPLPFWNVSSKRLKNRLSMPAVFGRTACGVPYTVAGPKPLEE